MRVFWFIIGLLACGAVAVWVASSKPAAAPANDQALAVSLPEPAHDQTLTKPITPALPAKVEAKAEATPIAEVATAEPKSYSTTTPTTTDATTTLAAASEAKSETKPEDKSDIKPEIKAETKLAVPPAEAPAAKVTKKDDGSLLIDDRFTVKGSGTAEAPYQLSWELLTSISESYDPRVGKKKLPDRLTMFEGKIVRLTGYVAYPMFVEQPREVLSMLNQWDGCCIGVPPTPYDAIEVHLKETVTKEQRLASYGSVEGKFSVKPYLAGDWLVGLYILADAKVTDVKANGQGS